MPYTVNSFGGEAAALRSSWPSLRHSWHRVCPQWRHPDCPCKYRFPPLPPKSYSVPREILWISRPSGRCPCEYFLASRCPAELNRRHHQRSPHRHSSTRSAFPDACWKRDAAVRTEISSSGLRDRKSTRLNSSHLVISY